MGSATVGFYFAGIFTTIISTPLLLLLLLLGPYSFIEGTHFARKFIILNILLKLSYLYKNF